MATPPILFAPVLSAEGWTSIGLQEQDILRALSRYQPQLSVTVLPSRDRWTKLPMGKGLVREVLYPLRIRRTAAAMPAVPVLHITDHSYGHLCAAHQPCIINCNDLHHFVRPELPPLQLWRWRRRVSTMRRASRILAISSHLANEVCQLLQVPTERVVALPGGIDTDVFHIQDRAASTALLPQLNQVGSAHRLILNIGVNIARKNLPTVLRALRRLIVDQHMPVKLVKIGPPLLQSEYRPLIDELGMTEHIVDLGPLTPVQVAAACNLADVLAFASLYEGFGRPTLEAQACGLPCVLADASCMREIGGEGALYHDPLSDEDLALQLSRVLNERDVRDSLVQAGLKNVQRFSWQAYSTKLVDIYQQVALHHG